MIVAISAGTSDPSTSTRLATALAQRVGDEYCLVELRLLASDLVTATTSRVVSPQLAEVLAAVSDAEALIVVTPIINAAYSGLTKLFFDALDEGALVGKPVLLGATGGTARHSLAIDQTLVPMFFYLKAAPVPAPVFAATDDWGHPGLRARIDAAGDALAAVLGRGGATPVARTVDDDFRLQTDFEGMLRQVQEGRRIGR